MNGEIWQASAGPGTRTTSRARNSLGAGSAFGEVNGSGYVCYTCNMCIYACIFNSGIFEINRYRNLKPDILQARLQGPTNA